MVGGSDEGLLRIIGEAGLPAQCAGIVVEQLVVVLKLVARCVAVAGEVVGAGADDVGERRVIERVAVEQAHVVGRRAHARTVEAGRCGHAGVAGAEFSGQRIDLLHRDIHAAERDGERVGGVVAGVHQQSVQQIIDGVAAADVDADLGALGVGVVLGALDDPVQWKFVDRLHGDQHLDDAGGTVAAVRVARRDDVPGVEVGDEPGLGGDVGG